MGRGRGAHRIELEFVATERSIAKFTPKPIRQQFAEGFVERYACQVYNGLCCLEGGDDRAQYGLATFLDRINVGLASGTCARNGDTWVFRSATG
jgi:hypothetical protein